MLIKRDIDAFLSRRMFGGKVLVIYGPRQSGKTTSIEHYLQDQCKDSKVLTFDGDEAKDRALLADASVEKLKLLIGSHKVVFIDEAQKIPEIGLVLKRLYDKVKDVQVIASGSSSEELASKTEEAMTGRKFTYTLFAPSFSELAGVTSPVEELRALEKRLVYGSYPDVVTHPGDEIERLREIGRGYLYKDILKYETIRRPEILDRLMRALAFQIGQEVSYSEIAETVGSDPKTISKYVDILEKAFIVFRLGSYARNLRNELKKSVKVYFYDTGIRNFVIGDWRVMDSRDPAEVGHLWENYVIAERRKWLLLHEPETRSFFWRTKQQQEVDLVEESANGLKAFEIKWNPNKAAEPLPRTFTNAYPSAETFGVSPDNVFEFLMG